jgi:hypothetical protein
MNAQISKYRQDAPSSRKTRCVFASVGSAVHPFLGRAFTTTTAETTNATAVAAKIVSGVMVGGVGWTTNSAFSSITPTVRFAQARESRLCAKLKCQIDAVLKALEDRNLVDSLEGAFVMDATVSKLIENVRKDLQNIVKSMKPTERNLPRSASHRPS